ncbi:hypothetical protein BDV28DRAFT_145342 [Aspergillus coremiiformis]|uniref:Hsp70 protein-domain-containing protein n=1 Tax=Aspergillus coremiiformis TaxID=138285 RepID=A0A5N6ZF61_9EURO|nr:hypothetical protein BDV28DRAFT_145342 [Aspergillus coremiiformis]
MNPNQFYTPTRGKERDDARSGMRIVVAVDFGTTLSTVAYGTTQNGLVVNYLSGIKGAVDEVFRATYDEAVARCPRDYIVTVPALWDHAEQQKTRRCAERAGMGEGSQLRVIPEPEVACIYAIQTMFSMQVGDTYVICDAGGGLSSTGSIRSGKHSLSTVSWRRRQRARGASVAAVFSIASSKIISVTCVLNIHIFTCENRTAANYKDDPTVWEIAEFTLDLHGLTIPKKWLNGIEFYEVEFEIEMTLRAASLPFCGVYGKGTPHARRFPATNVQFR